MQLLYCSRLVINQYVNTKLYTLSQLVVCNDQGGLRESIVLEELEAYIVMLLRKGRHVTRHLKIYVLRLTEEWLCCPEVLVRNNLVYKPALTKLLVHCLLTPVVTLHEL